MAQITALKIGDIPQLQNLAREIWLEYYSGMLPFEQINHMLVMMYDTGVVIAEVEAGVVYELIFNDNELIGYLSFGPEIIPSTYKLHKIYLKSAYRRQGIGKEMLEHVVQECERRGVKKIILSTYRGNISTQRMYERFGFKKIAEASIEIGSGFTMDDFVYQYLMPVS